jgi:GntR family transcriptional regulator, transcriptional repressor for pyruvate dehydrogenase complex
MANTQPSRELLPIERREATSVVVAGELLAYLLSGAVTPGERIPSERELAERLGVGRSAVREALKPLALLGVVDVRQGNGTFFRGTESALLPRVVEWGLLLGERTVADLVEARGPVEVALARLAAVRRTEDQLARLRGHLADMRAAGSVEDFTEADTAFHLCLAEAASSAVLGGILNSIRELLRTWIRTVVSDLPGTGPLYREHSKIFKAVQSQDPVAAAAAMEVHMENVSKRLLRVVGRGDASGVPGS